MICWDRLESDVVHGYFDISEVARLRRHATGLRTLLTADTFDNAMNDDPPPRTRATSRDGLVVAEPSRWTNDHTDDTIQQRRPITSQVLLHKVGVMLGTLPAQGGIVELPSFDHVFAWLWVLTDLQTLVIEFGGLEPERSRNIAVWLEEVANALYEVATKEVFPVETHLVDIINDACGPAAP